MLNTTPFEIITIGGSHFRFEKPNYVWQHGLVAGTSDVEDKTVVEVLFIDSDDESEVIATFSQVIMVGSVTDETFITKPREKRLTECSRCGFIEIENIKGKHSDKS